MCSKKYIFIVIDFNSWADPEKDTSAITVIKTRSTDKITDPFQTLIDVTGTAHRHRLMSNNTFFYKTFLIDVIEYFYGFYYDWDD